MCKKNKQVKSNSDSIVPNGKDTTNRAESQNERLLRKIKETYNSRFSAHRRLKHKAKMQRLTSYFISFWVLVASILLLLPSLINYKTDDLPFILLAISIFSLLVSIYFGEQNVSVEADNFHRCARELNSLYEELNSDKDNFDYKEGESAYETILNNYNLNHDYIDLEYTNELKNYRKNKVDGKRKNFFKTLKHYLYSISYRVRNDFIYWILILIPIIFGFFVYMNVTASGPLN